MHKVAYLVVLSACAGGFSLNGGSHSVGGGGGGPQSSNGTSIVSGGGGKAPFDSNKDCTSEESVAWHRDPVLRWDCFEYADLKGTPEYSEWAKSCDNLNERIGGASISCKMDHKGFDAHYAAEAKKAKNNDRDSSTPAYYCSQLMMEFNGQFSLMTDTVAMMKKTPATKRELLGKVKQITCAYDDERGGTVDLQGTNLVFFTSSQQKSGTIFTGIRKTKQFPELEKFFAEYGECKGGFSC